MTWTITPKRKKALLRSPWLLIVLPIAVVIMALQILGYLGNWMDRVCEPLADKLLGNN